MVIAQTLRQHLERERAAGTTFAEAWTAALTAIGQHPDAAEWLDVLRATRPAWQRAYDLEPATREERRLLALLVDPDREPLDTAAAELAAADRRCRRCDEPIPPTKQRNAVYCSNACQRAANGRTLAAA